MRHCRNGTPRRAFPTGIREDTGEADVLETFARGLAQPLRGHHPDTRGLRPVPHRLRELAAAMVRALAQGRYRSEMVHPPQSPGGAGLSAWLPETQPGRVRHLRGLVAGDGR